MMLPLPKGVYKVTNREPVKKGAKYITCLCKTCGQPLHLFPAPLFGVGVYPWFGEGKISAPCRHCKTDEIYDALDFVVMIAEKELPAAYEPRVEPAKKMARQLLLKSKYRKAKPTFGKHALEDRPKAAALIARIIGLTSELDDALAFMLLRMLKANSPPIAALFLSLRQSRFQFDALNAVAKSTLSNDDYKLFGALMTLRSSCDKERDALAHGRFGETPAISDGVVWVASYDYLQFSMRVEVEGLTDDATLWLRQRMYVYELADLERIARDTEATYESVRAFTGYLLSDDADWRAARYRSLCAEPHVRQALSQLSAGLKKSRSKPRGSRPRKRRGKRK